MAVIPNKFTSTLTFNIKKHHVIKAKKDIDRTLYFYADGSTSSERKEGVLFSLDSAFLKPIAEDRDYTVHFVNDKSPIVFDFGSMQDFYIIMPMKL